MPIDAPGRPRAADPRVRGALLLPLAILAVHQLRFYLAFGNDASARLAHEGHGYLSTVQPLALLASAIAAGAFIGRVATAWQTGHTGGPRRALVRTWALCALVLLAAYSAQELLEGAFAPGHPAGLAGVFGSGGWTAVPLALLIAAALATFLRVAEMLIGMAATRTADAPHARGPRSGALHAIPALGDWRLDPASGVSAGRAPPSSFSFG